MDDFNQLWGQIEHELGHNDHNMRRDRPYNGQAHTTTGERGKTEVKGVTFRDLRDCYIRAFFLANGVNMPTHYAEADKGESAALCENDLFGWDLNQVDPVAVFQNFACEVEKMMGIFPNVPKQEERRA
jgi:hypothetical protein